MPRPDPMLGVEYLRQRERLASMRHRIVMTLLSGVTETSTPEAASTAFDQVDAVNQFADDCDFGDVRGIVRTADELAGFYSRLRS